MLPATPTLLLLRPFHLAAVVEAVAEVEAAEDPAVGAGVAEAAGHLTAAAAVAVPWSPKSGPRDAARISSVTSAVSGDGQVWFGEEPAPSSN